MKLFVVPYDGQLTPGNANYQAITINFSNVSPIIK